jgi:branched-chain amino acid transport system ATP-binding protein
MALLELKKVCTRYGKVPAITDVDVYVEQGEVVCIIGANGAGKSTTMKTIAGLLAHQAGTIEFRKKRIDQVPGHQRVKMGIMLVPEGREVFAPLTVDENLLMGGYLIRSTHKLKQEKKRVFEVFPRLEERRNQKAGTLSGGEQQMLAMGRALMANPAMLMIDEPSLGLSPVMVNEIFSVIRRLNHDGCTIFLVEQNAQLALEVGHRAYVMETGKIVLSGKTADLLNDERVRKAYLGA